MEWWETDQYEPVDEISKDLAQKAYDKRFMKAGLNPFDTKNKYRLISNIANYKKRIGDEGLNRGVNKAFGAAAGIVGATYLADKGIRHIINKKQKERDEEAAKAAEESWLNDSDALAIMETYYSEFKDADMY